MKNSSARPIILSVVLAVLGVAAGVWAATWLQRGSYLTALIVLVAAVWGFGFATYFLYTTSGAATPRAKSGPAGTLLRPDRVSDVSLVAGTSAVSIAAAMYLLFAPLGLVDYVPTGVMRTILPLGCGALIAFGAPTLYRMFKHRGGGHLRLDPDGFEVWNGQWGTFRRGNWDEVEQILDHPLRGNRPFNKVVVFVLPKRRTAMLIADAITGNSDALREWVRFYWQHPEYRDELVDHRGVQRLADERFTP